MIPACAITSRQATANDSGPYSALKKSRTLGLLGRMSIPCCSEFRKMWIAIPQCHSGQVVRNQGWGNDRLIVAATHSTVMLDWSPADERLWLSLASTIPQPSSLSKLTRCPCWTHSASGCLTYFRPIECRSWRETRMRTSSRHGSPRCCGIPEWLCFVAMAAKTRGTQGSLPNGWLVRTGLAFVRCLNCAIVMSLRPTRFRNCWIRYLSTS